MANKKLKLLYLAQYLWEQTDEQHPGTMQEIIAYLASCGISAERKSLYDDLELLRLYGMDVQSVKGRSFGYFLGERDFQLPELKLLIDVVQAAPTPASCGGRCTSWTASAPIMKSCTTPWTA